MLACLDVIMGGVLERFPRLRFAFLESGCGWVPFWLERMDEHWERHIQALAPVWNVIPMRETLKLRPSEYFCRQCYVSAESEERLIPTVMDIVGEDKLLWASDFPHIDATYPGALNELMERTDISEPRRGRILSDNPRRFYRLSD
jgi:predicted TIM-barrel fold metal-dependent hydrolase